jgi:hypothetical protein
MPAEAGMKLLGSLLLLCTITSPLGDEIVANGALLIKVEVGVVTCVWSMPPEPQPTREAKRKSSSSSDRGLKAVGGLRINAVNFL